MGVGTLALLAFVAIAAGGVEDGELLQAGAIASIVANVRDGVLESCRG